MLLILLVLTNSIINITTTKYDYSLQSMPTIETAAPLTDTNTTQPENRIKLKT